ncbi:hypothetical protein HHI36_007045 [Cryptolaemus montrouzieri]|uniref:ZAD domain-containing protein n=1 Tax=Cryptolaemus montrouzieri TaxID=559131 RepID=A0ABD2MNG4_9CUCU
MLGIVGNIQEISKLCRCCMENGQFNIFTTVFETQMIAKLIGKCTSSEISFEDEYPKTICQQCFDKVVSCYLFLTKYQKVQKLLQNLLKMKKSSKEINLIVIQKIYI